MLTAPDEQIRERNICVDCGYGLYQIAIGAGIVVVIVAFIASKAAVDVANINAEAPTCQHEILEENDQ